MGALNDFWGPLTTNVPAPWRPFFLAAMLGIAADFIIAQVPNESYQKGLRLMVIMAFLGLYVLPLIAKFFNGIGRIFWLW